VEKEKEKAREKVIESRKDKPKEPPSEPKEDEGKKEAKVAKGGKADPKSDKKKDKHVGRVESNLRILDSDMRKKQSQTTWVVSGVVLAFYWVLSTRCMGPSSDARAPPTPARRAASPPRLLAAHRGLASSPR
jgi:hypothetical protein